MQWKSLNLSKKRKKRKNLLQIFTYTSTISNLVLKKLAGGKKNQTGLWESKCLVCRTFGSISEDQQLNLEAFQCAFAKNETTLVWCRPEHEPTCYQQVERKGDGDDGRQENTYWCNQPVQVPGGQGRNGRSDWRGRVCEEKTKSTAEFLVALLENGWCGTSLGPRLNLRRLIKMMMKHRPVWEGITLA